MEPLAFDLSGDPSTALNAALGAMSGLGYRITPDPGGWSGTAEVGSVAARVLAGGFVRRMVVNYRVETVGDGSSRLTIEPGASGWSGGALGASKAKKEFRSIADAVTSALAPR